MTKTILVTAAILLALGVMIGAFGAHGLKSRVTPDLLQVYKTGVEYHFYHALGLLLIGVLSFSMPSSYLNMAALFLFAGILIFSGSLYLLAITEIKWIGAVTPLGGLSFIVGWVLFVIAIVKHFPKSV